MPASHDAYLGLVPSSLRFLCRARNSRGKNHLNCGMSARNYFSFRRQMLICYRVSNWTLVGFPLRRPSFHWPCAASLCPGVRVARISQSDERNL